MLAVTVMTLSGSEDPGALDDNESGSVLPLLRKPAGVALESPHHNNGLPPEAVLMSKPPAVKPGEMPKVLDSEDTLASGMEGRPKGANGNPAAPTSLNSGDW
jgi:hypothetical protein